MLRLTITGIVLDELPARQQIGETIEQRIDAQIHFLISDPVTKQVSAGPSVCFVQLLAHEISTGRTTVLAVERQPLHQDEVDYTTAVTFAMPAVGRYQLIGMVLLPDVSIVDVALGPTLRVVL